MYAHIGRLAILHTSGISTFVYFYVIPGVNGFTETVTPHLRSIMIVPNVQRRMGYLKVNQKVRTVRCAEAARLRLCAWLQGSCPTV